MTAPRAHSAMSTAETPVRTHGTFSEMSDEIGPWAGESRWGRIWLVVAIVSGLAGLILRLGIVASRDLWADEAFTWRVTSFPFDRMMARLQADIHPPLHYVLMWLLQENAPGGWGPTYLRVANLAWFAVLGLLAAWSCRRPELRAALVPAFAVAAVAPGFVTPSADLRMYGLLLMLAAVLLVGVTTIVERPSRAAIVVCALAATAAAWTHYGGVVAGAAIITAGLLRGGRKRFKALVPVALVFALGVLALVPFALPQLGHGISYSIGLSRMAGNVWDNLSVLGLALLAVTAVLALWWVIQERASGILRRSTELATIALISAVFFSLGNLAWYVVKGQNPVNEGVSTVAVFLPLVGILGLKIVPPLTTVAIVLLAGMVTAGLSVARLWGTPDYSLGTPVYYSVGKRVSSVDVLDKAIREYPPLSSDGGRGWLIVEVDWSDLNVYFREQASKRLPNAAVAVGTPARGVAKAKIEGSNGAYQRILVIRRPGTAYVGEIRGYKLQLLDRWTAIYSAEK